MGKTPRKTGSRRRILPQTSFRSTDSRMDPIDIPGFQSDAPTRAKQMAKAGRLVNSPRARIADKAKRIMGKTNAMDAAGKALRRRK